MGTLVIFWAAVLALLVYIAGIFFKFMASAFKAFLTAIINTLGVGIVALLAVLSLFLLYATVHVIVKEGFVSAFSTLFLLAVSLMLFFLFLGPLGAALYGITAAIVRWFLNIVSKFLEGLAEKCERSFYYFLKVIINRLNN